MGGGGTLQRSGDMERLKLVEPAASLWRTAGPTIRKALKELQDGPHEWRFGGGTILATRWGHRLSFDIDLTVTGNADLRELAPECNAEFDAAIRYLGGEPRHAPGSLKIDFETGSIEIARLDPIPATGEGRFTIDERDETVLSTTQILCGKLERAPRSPVRDVFDFVAAKQADPRALAAAANSLYEGHARAIAAHWGRNDRRFADEATKDLKGIDTRFQCDFRTLGTQAGDALVGALYKRCVIYTEHGSAFARTETGSGTRATIAMDPDNIDRDFEANALNDYLRRNWFKPEKARRHVPQVCKGSTERRVLWDSDRALYGRYPSDGGLPRLEQ